MQVKERNDEVTKDLSVVGKKLPRVDAFEKAIGLGQYTGDIRIPNMLHGVLLRSPYPHAKIVSTNTKDAELLPGVKAFITHHNVTRKSYNAAAADNALAFPPVKPIEDQYIFERSGSLAH